MGEPFRDYAQQITIVESKMEFGKDGGLNMGDPSSPLSAESDASPIDWKELHLHVDFLRFSKLVRTLIMPGG